MFCENCGKPNPDEALFCEHCGAKMEAVAPVAVATAAPKPKLALMEKVKQFHQKNKLVLPIAAAVLVVLIAVCIIISVVGKHVDVSNYMDIRVTGYDGYGVFTYVFDEESFAMRALGLKEYKGYGDFEEADLDEDELQDIQLDNKSKMKNLEKLMDSINISVELPEGRTRKTLKNGDVIKFVVELNEKTAKKLDITPKNLSFEYTVSDLKGPSSYNPLDNFTIDFEGYNGYGRYELVCTKTEERDLGSMIFTTREGQRYIEVAYKESGDTDSFYVYHETESDGLKNGDTVRMYMNVEPNMWASYGVLLGYVQKDVTVEGLEDLQEYDPMENFKVVFSGYNGYGSYELVCTKSERKEIGSLVFVTEEGSRYVEVEYVDGGYSNSYYVNTETDSSALKNGDSVRMYVSVQQNRWAEYGVVLKDTQKNISVAGLKDVQEYDPLSNLQVVFTGLNGDGDASIQYVKPQVAVGELTFDFERGGVYLGDEYITYLNYSISSKWGLSNGQELTLSVSSNENYLARNGVKLKQLQKTVTVSNLAVYASNLDSVRSLLGSVTDQAKSILNDWMYDEWNYAVHGSYWGGSDPKIIAEPVLHKVLLSVPKSSTNSTKNTLWLVFKATVQDSEITEPTEVYFTLCVKNIAVTGSGELYLTTERFDKYKAEMSYQDAYDKVIYAYNVDIFE